MSSRYSLDVKLPLVIAALLAGSAALVVFLAYGAVRRSELDAAFERLRGVATQLASSPRVREELARVAAVAAQPEVVAAAEHGADTGAARAALAQLRSDAQSLITVELRDAAGRLRVATVAVPDAQGAAAPRRPDSAAVSALFVVDSLILYEVTAPVRSGNRTVGHVVERRRVASSAGARAAIQGLIGPDAVVLAGNADGSLWTDLAAPTTVGLLEGTWTMGAVYERAGQTRLAVAAPIPGTPWLFAAEFPRTTVLRPARTLLGWFAGVGTLVVALGGFAGWGVSRRITRPLRALTRDAEALAATHHARLALPPGGDEVARLTDAFAVMAARVADRQHRLIGEVAARTDEVRDIEQRWRAEAELYRTQEVLRAVFEASPLPIVALDVDERVQFWNAAAERVFGWTAEEVIGRPLPIIPEDAREESHALASGALRGETFLGLDVRRRRRDGTLLDLRMTVAAVRERDGRAGGVLAVYEDVTERRRLEEHVRHAQRLDAVGRLAGGIAHDFNNLLTVIMGEVDLALPDAAEPGVREALLTTRRTAERGAALTRQLMAFARRQPLAPAVFSPNDLVEDLEKMLRRLLGERVTFTARLDPAVGSIRADRGQIEQVLTNLVVNARDAMQGAGTLTIATANRSVAAGDLGALPPGDWVEIAVTDTGSGIAPEIRSRLFEPFFTTKERGQGTGLGLATSYGIVTQHDGHLLVESEVGRGSTFRVILPRVAAIAADAHAVAASLPAATRGERLLLVEDIASVREVSLRLLARAGYAVTAVASATEAHEQVARVGAPDLLVTDVNLPDYSGVELATQLRARHPGLRVVYVSGSPDNAMLTGLGGALLLKPFDADALARAVRAALDAES